MEDEHGHGHSIAAWSGVLILILASTLLSIGIYFGLAWANWVGIALVVIGIGAWVGLSSAGYGQSQGASEH
ncbi:MAG: HGxxPAAW family protein [Ornithinimicrobium sp.]|uniref:HGxxPAAW family protein n=1 Tax=Ornithinimicrobium sp. TaxID=1977084 RepID=UPI003D9AEE6F